MRLLKLLLASLTVISIAAFSHINSLESVTPDGKIILFYSVEGDQLIFSCRLIVPGVVAAQSQTGNIYYSMKDVHGNTLATGSIDLPRYIYEDELNPDGTFSGGRRQAEIFSISLPYYNEAETISFINTSDEIVSEIDLNSLEEPDVAISPLANRITTPPDFKGYFDYLDTINNRYKAAPTISKRSAATATKTITLNAEVPGVDESELGFWAYFRNLTTGDTKFVNEYTSPVNVELPEGEYELEYIVRYADPDTVDSYGSVYLMDTFNHKIFFNTSVNSITLKAALGYLRALHMKAPDGTGINGTVRILSPVKPQSTREFSYENFSTRSDGRFFIRMASKAYPMVFQPDAIHEEKVGAAVKIVKVSRFYTGITDVILPVVGARNGATLQHIWGGNSDPFGPANVDIRNQLNILFMAEGYTNKQERFSDLNGNGVWDGDLLLDINGNGVQDEGEKHVNRDPTREYNPPEPFEDTNGDRICNRFERAKFELDCALNAAGMLNFYPFNEFMDRINFFSYWTPSEHAVQKMTFTVPWSNSSTYFGVTSDENRSSRIGNAALVTQTAASALPDYTIPVVLVNDPLSMIRSNAYYNFGRILQRSNSGGGLVFVHELGHSLGSLADEYVESGNEDVTYTDPDPGRVNVTTETDPAKVKWRKYFNGTPPVPTPKRYEGYGLFEGAYYHGYGIYRPTESSMMRNYAPFFAVNEERLRTVLSQFRSSGKVNYQSNIIINDLSFTLKKRGDKYRLKTVAAMKNAGKATSDTDRFYYYLSTDKKIDADDILLGSKPLKALKPDQAFNLKKAFTLKNLDTGKYNLIGLVDRDNILSDVDMAFKVKVAPKKIRIR